MTYYDDRNRYGSERYFGNRFRYDDDYSYSESNTDLISVADGRSVASSYRPHVSARYNPYTFYYDQPKNNDRVYHMYDRYFRPDVDRSVARGYYGQDKPKGPVVLGYSWNTPPRYPRRSYGDDHQSAYKDEESEDGYIGGGCSIKICVAISIVLLVLLMAAGLGLGLGFALTGDDDSDGKSSN